MIEGLRRSYYSPFSQPSSALTLGLTSSIVIAGLLKRHPVTLIKAFSLQSSVFKSLGYQYPKQVIRHPLEGKLAEIFNRTSDCNNRPLGIFNEVHEPLMNIEDPIECAPLGDSRVFCFAGKVFSAKHSLLAEGETSYALTLEKGESKQKLMTVQAVDSLLSLLGLENYKITLDGVSISHPKTLMFKGDIQNESTVMEFTNPAEAIRYDIKIGRGVLSITKTFGLRELCLKEDGTFSVKIDRITSDKKWESKEVNPMTIGHIDSMKDLFSQILE
jgi:hypothetical protein